ncbi:hypothetical protein BH23CHL5_BH23CHL5_23730 [soil metagenome]
MHWGRSALEASVIAGTETITAIVQDRCGGVPAEVKRVEKIESFEIRETEVLVKIRAAGVDLGTAHEGVHGVAAMRSPC